LVRRAFVKLSLSLSPPLATLSALDCSRAATATWTGAHLRSDAYFGALPPIDEQKNGPRSWPRSLAHSLLLCQWAKLECEWAINTTNLLHTNRSLASWIQPAEIYRHVKPQLSSHQSHTLNADATPPATGTNTRIEQIAQRSLAGSQLQICPLRHAYLYTGPLCFRSVHLSGWGHQFGWFALVSWPFCAGTCSVRLALAWFVGGVGLEGRVESSIGLDWAVAVEGWRQLVASLLCPSESMHALSTPSLNPSSRDYRPSSLARAISCQINPPKRAAKSVLLAPNQFSARTKCRQLPAAPTYLLMMIDLGRVVGSLACTCTQSGRVGCSTRCCPSRELLG